MKTRVLILGGGFAGVKCALELQKKNIPNLQIRLISNRDNFEYHGALYRLVAGRSPLEVCLPLRNILDESRVEIINDNVVSIDKENRVVTGESGSTYHHDILVVALGAETDYFGVPGLREHAWGMKTISDALALKNHIQETLALCPSKSLAERTKSLHFVVIGGGPTGVEMAGELSAYIRQLARRYGLDPELVSVDLVERAPRILPSLHKQLAQRITKRLEKLGVRVRTACSVTSLDDDLVTCSDATTESLTTVWTAGVRASRLVDQLKVEQDRSGRLVVTENLQIPGWDHIYAAGDVAVTPFSGMAQTAIHDGRYIANCIARLSEDDANILPNYHAGEPIYAIPVGPGWAGTQWGRARFYGVVGWFLRRLVDWVVFINFLSFRRAIDAFRSHYHVQGENNHK